MQESLFRRSFEIQWQISRLIAKFFTTARKSILESVKLQSLVAKCCKMKKIALCKFRQFCRYLCITCRNLRHVLLSRKWCKLLHVIQKYTKFVKFAGLYSPASFYNISPPNFAILLILRCSF